MINSNKCRNKKILGFAWKGIKTQGTSGGIHSVPTFFPKNFKLWHQKIFFGSGHQDIGQKL